jgi:mono/diheme cytochrome c family protein
MGIGRYFLGVLLGLVFWTSTAVGQDNAEAAKVDFEREIEPILAARCIKCHGPDKQKEGLRLDRAASAFRGGDSGEPGIVPGDSAHSELFRRITANEHDRMPFKGEPLTADQIALIERWIDEGASWPEDGSVDADQPTHWSFQPIGDPRPPQTGPSWGSSPIDAFVLRRLDEEGLRPSPVADRVTLIRRLFLDLHGLLPTPARVEAFIRDRREDAWERLVDEVLASPRYGERWAQHWLDVVQYADSHGFEMNNPRPNAYQYRDWLIEAFNDDVPYHRFIFEQLAGDTVGVDAATGFLVAGAWDQVESRLPAYAALQRQDELTAMVNTTGTAFLGLTLGCARCHAHKFDPVPQRDFYAMTAVFAGVRHGERPLYSKEDALILSQRAEIEVEIESLRSELPRLRPVITSRYNEERFEPVHASAVRMRIFATNGAEPCIDELEVWSGEMNVALTAEPSSSGDYQNNPKHKLEHINDGQFGNPRSWISNEPGGGRIQLDLSEPAIVDRVVWGRDRHEQLADRTPTNYIIEVREAPDRWTMVAGSQDRLLAPPPPGAIGAEDGLSSGTSEITRRIFEAEERVRALKIASPDMVYAGKLEQPGPIHRLYRGDVTSKREAVAPDTISVLGTLGLAMDAPEKERRAALARGLADPSNPLTARVMANRIWYHHFGTGIVSTPGDFGANGGLPSHPELLDWLARQLMRGDWSIKNLHREILNSSTYRQASGPSATGLARDAGARLLWRFPPRRLEAEVIRDCILQLSGSLDLTMGGPGFSTFKPNDNYVRVYTPKETTGPTEWRRMVYMHKVRMERAPLFGAFDLPDAGQVCPKRSLSTTAIQALNLFNGIFVLQQAQRMAELLTELDGDPVEHAYRSAYGRKPSMREASAAETFIKEHGLAAFCRAVLNSNELVFLP